MNTAKNLHDISAIYFFALAFLYVISALALRNGFHPTVFEGIMRIFDLPFAFVGLFYGGSTIYLQMKGRNDEGISPWVMVLFTFCMIIFAFMVFLTFAFPSKL